MEVPERGNPETTINGRPNIKRHNHFCIANTFQIDPDLDTEPDGRSVTRHGPRANAEHTLSCP